MFVLASMFSFQWIKCPLTMINLRDILSLPVLLVNFYGYVASLTKLETRARTLSYTTLYSYNKFRDLGSDKDFLYSGLNNNKILYAQKKNFFGPISSQQQGSRPHCRRLFPRLRNGIFYLVSNEISWLKTDCYWGCCMSKKVFTINVWIFYIILQPVVSGLGHLIKCTPLWLFRGNTILF